MTVLSGAIIILLGVTMSSCDKSVDMSSYYFPVDQLKNGQYYNYVSVNDTRLPDDQWLYHSYDRDSQTVLISKAFDYDGEVTQVIVESVSTLGILADTVTLFLKDSLGKDVVVSAKVSKRAVFPFYRNPEDTLIYSIMWVDPEDQLEYTFSRKRVFKGDTTYDINGEALDAIRFDLIESLETFWVHDGTTSSEWSGSEIYAKGVGLVYYIKRISPEFTREYRLDRRYSPE
jgi:hypothetical protein